VLPKKPATSGLLSIEEEMIVLALQHPSEEMGRMLDAIPLQEGRCRAVWQVMRTKLPGGTLYASEVLSGLPEDVRDWLTPLAIQERRYAQPLGMLADLAAAWQRQKDVLEWQALKAEIDSMIEGRIPLDAHKVQIYNDLSKRLKGSKSELTNLREAPLHG
jgi:hypothetical protein